jgi:hypothetical protein
VGFLFFGDDFVVVNDGLDFVHDFVLSQAI